MMSYVLKEGNGKGGWDAWDAHGAVLGRIGVVESIIQFPVQDQ